MKHLPTLPAQKRMPLAAGAVVLWVAVSPWTWGFAGSGSAVANHIFFVLAFGPLGMMIAVLRPAAVVALAGGIWLALSPWVLGYAANHAAWLNELVSGGALVVLCSHAVRVGGLVQAGSRPALARASGPEPVSVETVGSR
jgi:hypothetical protein